MRFIPYRFCLKPIVEYFICFLMIYLTGSGWISTHEDAFVFRVLSVLLIVLCMVYEFVFLKSWKSIERAFVFLFYSFIFVFLEYLLFSKTIFGFALRIMWLFAFILILFSKKSKPQIFLHCTYRIILFIAVCSLIIYFLVNIVKFDIPYDYVPYGNDRTFYRRYLGFFYAAGIYLRELPIWGIRVFRLQSFFWEPGVYAVYLIYALYYFVFKKKEKRVLEIVCLLLSIILTFSTTGICVGLALFVVYFVRNFPVNKCYRKFLYFPLGIFSLFIIYKVWIAKKTNSSGSISGSYSLRVSDIVEGIKLIAKRPIFGWGYKNYLVFENAQNLGRGSSNGLITLGYTMGLVGLFIVLFPFVANVFRSKKKVFFEEFVFLLVFVFTNMTEPLILNPFMLFLISYQYSKLLFRTELDSSTNTHYLSDSQSFFSFDNL